jgi:hypothetical protein
MINRFINFGKRIAMKTNCLFNKLKAPLSSLLYSAILFLITLSACKPNNDSNYLEKEVTTEVDGYLLVRGSLDTLKDKPYRIALVESPSYRNPHIFDEIYTDENGYFKLSHTSIIKYYIDFQNQHNAEELIRYSVHLLDELTDAHKFRGDGRVELNPNWSYPFMESHFFSGYNGRSNIVKNKKAWLKLHVENIDPQPGDWLHLRFPTGDFQNNLYGYVNDTIILLGIANANNALRYTYQKTNGNSTGGLLNDSIMLGEMDTTYYKFEY